MPPTSVTFLQISVDLSFNPDVSATAEDGLEPATTGEARFSQRSERQRHPSLLDIGVRDRIQDRSP